MTNVLQDIARALEPLHPYYAMSWDKGDTEVELAVYDPSTHDRTGEFQLTPGPARLRIEGCARFSIDGDEATYEEFVNLLDQLDAGTAPQLPPTCSINDAFSFLLDAHAKGDFEVTIDGATWLIRR